MGLLKLVIVDDEPILLEGLVKTYDWNGMGYETDFRTYGNGRNQEREPGMSVRGIKCIQGF